MTTQAKRKPVAHQKHLSLVPARPDPDLCRGRVAPVQPAPEECEGGCGDSVEYWWLKNCFSPNGGRWMRPEQPCKSCQTQAQRQERDKRVESALRQMGRLPASPPETEPPPAPVVRCAREGCEAHVPMTWIGWWEPDGLFCEEHQEEALLIEEARRAEHMLMNSGLPARFQGYSFGRTAEMNIPAARVTPQIFNTFRGSIPADTLGVTPWNKQLVADLRRMLERPRSVLLTGKVGTGKSTLAACVVTGLVRRGMAAYYMPEGELWEAVYREIRTHSPGDIRYELARVPYLVLDDLGIEKGVKEFQQDTIDKLVSHRWNHELPMFVTTNCSLNEIARSYGERVVSRLMDMNAGRPPIGLGGPDWRSGIVR